MATNEPHRIAASKVRDLQSRIRESRVDRQFEVDLFLAFHTKTVRLARQSPAYFIDEMPREDSGHVDRQLWQINHGVTEQWVSESSDFDTDYCDDNGRLIFEVVQFGYLNKDDDWVPRPKLDLVPRYTTNVEDSLHLRVFLLGNTPKLRIEEIRSEWGMQYGVSLVVADGKVVASAARDFLSVAILEVLLLTLLSDWTPEFESYEITEE